MPRGGAARGALGLHVEDDLRRGERYEEAIGRFRELQQLTGEVDSLGEQLEARKLIDRAKGKLMDERGMKENDAFAFIQRTAMSERTKMSAVAQRIIDGDLQP